MFCWFLLFPANRMVVTYGHLEANVKDSNGEGLFIEEWKVACLIGALESFWFCFFAWGTIQQICDALKIKCFTIKKQPEWNKSK